MLTAQITGGLGNQLFTYTRLATYAHQNGMNLQIDGSIAERVLGRTPDLFDFRLLGESQILAKSYSPIKTQLERVYWRSQFARTLSKRYQENTLGESQFSRSNLDGWKIRGFFQDYRVAEEFITTFGKTAITLKSESSTLTTLTEELKLKRVLGIHVRRGDYLNYQDSFGLLSRDYYLDAYKTISETKSFSKVMIFTDSPDLVEDLRSHLKIESQIVSPSELSTSETMILMSRCSGLITSNSTFSFWAATLGIDLEVVIPDPWFKSKDSWLRSADFANPRWIKQKAVWSQK